jgi:putative phage-type endonuclease
VTAAERHEWLIKRQQGIGSSDAPNLCGVGFRTAADVYRSKVKPITQRDLTSRGVLKRGTIMEPLVAAEYAEEMGVSLTQAKHIVHPARPWQFASPDYLRDDNGRMVELKTVGVFGFEWGQTGTDDFPEGYRIQCQHQMGVRGQDSIDLAALDVVSWELRIFRLDFDPAFFEWLTDLEFQAWTLIQHRLPIGDEWEKQWTEKARELIDNGSRYMLPDDTLPILQRREIFKRIEKEAKAEADELTTELYVRMGDFYKAECCGWKVSQSMIKETIVAESVREAHRQLRVTPPKAEKRKALPPRKVNVEQSDFLEACYQNSIYPEENFPESEISL